VHGGECGRVRSRNGCNGSREKPHSPPWRQPRGNSMVSLVNSHTNATRIGWHLWEIDLKGPKICPWVASRVVWRLHLQSVTGRGGCRARYNPALPRLTVPTVWQGGLKFPMRLGRARPIRTASAKYFPRNTMHVNTSTSGYAHHSADTGPRLAQSHRVPATCPDGCATVPPS